MAPSMVVLLNTPLILLPMRLIPKDSPLFDVFLQAKTGKGLLDNARRGGRVHGFGKSACSLREVAGERKPKRRGGGSKEQRTERRSSDCTVGRRSSGSQNEKKPECHITAISQ